MLLLVVQGSNIQEFLLVDPGGRLPAEPCPSVQPDSTTRMCLTQDLIVMDDAEPHPNHQPVQSTGHQMDLLTSDPETDPSDEEESSQQMRLVYRRDQNGYKYRTWEPVQDKQPQVVYE
jgi:hypothetical protein